MVNNNYICRVELLFNSLRDVFIFEKKKKKIG